MVINHYQLHINFRYCFDTPFGIPYGLNHYISLRGDISQRLPDDYRTLRRPATISCSKTKAVKLINNVSLLIAMATVKFQPKEVIFLSSKRFLPKGKKYTRDIYGGIFLMSK